MLVPDLIDKSSNNNLLLHRVTEKKNADFRWHNRSVRENDLNKKLLSAHGVRSWILARLTRRVLTILQDGVYGREGEN